MNCKTYNSNVPETYTKPHQHPSILKVFCVIVILSIAFAYIESAVVVYLRAIFYPEGFNFPIVFGESPLWKKLIFTETGREAATIVLIFAVAWLSGKNAQRRFAFFLIVFAVWDIFYYVWLKILINWPGSIMDWDILFLIPLPWASPVLAPLLIAGLMLLSGTAILYYCDYPGTIKNVFMFKSGLIFAAFLMVISFCIAGFHIARPDFKSHFYWSLFGSGYILAVIMSLRYFLKIRK